MQISPEGLTTSTVPRVFVKNVLLETDGADGMAVTATVIMKQQTGQTSPFSLSRLRLKGLLTSDRLLAKDIAQDTTILAKDLADSPETVSRNISAIDSLYSSTMSTETYTTTGNLTTKDIAYTIKINFPSDRPKDLALFVLPYVISEEESQLGSTNAQLSEYGFGTSDIIIKNSKINQSGLVFLLPHAPGATGGQLWLGPVHKHADNTWMTGVYHTASSKLLVTKEVQNSKVKDFRIREKLQKLYINQNSLKGGETLNNTVIQRLKKLSTLNSLRERKSDYISPIHLATDSSNNVKYHFTLDFLNMVKENCEFASLYANEGEILSSAKILSFKIIRRRVHDDFVFNRLTGGGVSNRLFSKNEIEETISSGIGDSLERVDVSPSIPGLLHYFGTDESMDGITTGKYQYGVVIDVTDLTKVKILDFLFSPQSGLASKLSDLKNYLALASLPKNYNPSTNSFTGNFMGLGSSPIWQEATSKYIDLISMILGPNHMIDDMTLEDYENILQNISSPHSGNPSGIMLLISLIEKLIQDLSSLLKATNNQKPHTDNFGASARQATGVPKNIFSFKSFFKKSYDSDHPAQYGLDYLSAEGLTAQPSGPLMRTVSYSAWEERIRFESSKYFEEGSGEVNTHGYLGASYIKLPNQEAVKIVSEGEGAEDTASALYNILAANARKSSPVNLVTRKANFEKANINTVAAVKVSNKVSALEAAGASMENSNRTTGNIFKIAAASDQSHLNTTAILGKDSSFVQEAPPSQRISGSSENVTNKKASFAGSKLLEKLEANDNSITNQLLESDAFNGFSSDRPTTTKTVGNSKAAPASKTSKSLAEASFKSAVGNTQPLPADVALVAAKFGFTKKIEYLSGFKKDESTGYTFIKEPTWLELAENVYENAKTLNRVILCRIVDHDLSLPSFKGFDMPVYNEYFLIGPARSKKTNSTNVGSIPSIRRSTKREEFILQEAVSSYADFGKSSKLPSSIRLIVEKANKHQQKIAKTPEELAPSRPPAPIGTPNLIDTANSKLGTSTATRAASADISTPSAASTKGNTGY